MIELIHARLPELTAEAELLRPYGVGNDVRQVAGDVIAAFRGREPDALKPGNLDLWRPKNGLPAYGRVRTQEQAQGLGIEGVVEVVKDLVEVIHAHQYLIRQARRKRGVQHERVVEHMDGGDFEIVL